MSNSQSATSDQEVWTESIDSQPFIAEESGQTLSEKLAAFVRLCWQRRRFVVAVVFIGMALSVLYAYLLPNIYTSTTTLLPPDNSSAYSNVMNMFNSSGVASVGMQALGLDSPGELFVSILQSRNVQDGLIARFDLVHYYHSSMLGDARHRLAVSTKVSQDLKSGLITISVTDADPVMATRLAKGYVEELNRVVSDDSTSSARRERIFLEARIKDIKQDLDQSSNALSQFSAKSRTIDITTQAKSMMDTGMRLEAELMMGRSELAALRQTYAEDNFRVKAAEARIAELQRQVDALGGKQDANTRNSASSDSAYPSVAELPALGQTMSDLEREVKVDEALWEALTRQYETAKVEEAKQLPTVRVLDAAEIPQRKTSPVRRNILAVGTMISLVLAILLVIAGRLWEEADPQSEPKKLLMETFAGLRVPRWWPGRVEKIV